MFLVFFSAADLKIGGLFFLSPFSRPARELDMIDIILDFSWKLDARSSLMKSVFAAVTSLHSQSFLFQTIKKASMLAYHLLLPYKKLLVLRVSNKSQLSPLEYWTYEVFFLNSLSPFLL